MSERVQGRESSEEWPAPIPQAPLAPRTTNQLFYEFCRLYLGNHVFATQLKQLSLEKSDLFSKLLKL